MDMELGKVGLGMEGPFEVNGNQEPEEGRKMNLLSLPVELIEGHLLPMLGWNDLLRFRKTCWAAWDITTDYIRVHPELAPELEINEEGKSFKKFLEMGIPTTKLFLNNLSGKQFYERDFEDLLKFLEGYGPVVRCLRVKELSLMILNGEREFMQGLVNLESLEGAHFGREEETGEIGAEPSTALLSKDNPGQLPVTFGTLKRVKIGQEEYVDQENLIICALPFTFFCWNLEFWGFPINFITPVDSSVNALEESRNARAFAFEFLYNAITSRKDRKTGNLKLIDFTNYHDEKERVGMRELFGCSIFWDVCVLSLQNGIKLRNVSASWFQTSDTGMEMEAGSSEIGAVVESMVNILPHVFPLEMPNLERIDIRVTSHCDVALKPGQSRPYWPALKSLEINVDTGRVFLMRSVVADVENDTVALTTHRVFTHSLFDFFFRDIQRLGLVELCLKFQENVNQIAIPDTRDIVRACPNLKKLRIVNWPGTNKALVKLWDGLLELEEISLENCKQLGNVAFVGEDRENPSFLKLKNLKKLSLKGLDQMPKVTDTLFSLVISHLPLIHFILTSNDPVKTVTLKGIESLLSGQFAESIEKFPFTNWSLENVPLDEFIELEKKFRSNFML